LDRYASLQSADKDQQERCAVAEKPHGAVVKFDRPIRIEIYSGIARSPCDSTALEATINKKAELSQKRPRDAPNIWVP